MKKVEAEEKIRKPMKVRVPESHKNRKVSTRPVVFDEGNRNIATLIGFLIAIMVGVGSGWVIGSALSSIADSAGRQSVTSAQQMSDASLVKPVVPASNAEKDAEASKVGPVEPGQNEPGQDSQAKQDLQARAAKQDDRQAVASETQDDYRPARSRRPVRRAYVESKGDSVPVAIIKGKPLRKAFRPLKKVKFW